MLGWQKQVDFITYCVPVPINGDLSSCFGALPCAYSEVLILQPRLCAGVV